MNAPADPAVATGSARLPAQVPGFAGHTNGAAMTIYISASELPIVLACIDADLDLVVAEVAHWADAGLTNVFRSDPGAGYIVNFGRVTAFTISDEIPPGESGKLVFPIEMAGPAPVAARARAVEAEHHDHDHEHGHSHDPAPSA